MSWTRWLRALKPQLTSLRSRLRPARIRPTVESLEDRNLFAVSIISTADPSFLAANAPVTAANIQSEITPVHSISDDGTYTVYASTSTNLVKGEIANNPVTLNIYLYNSVSLTTTMVSHSATSATTQGNGASFNPTISGDGSTVVFYSFATNLISGDTIPSGTVQLYSYNVSNGTLSLVSHTTTSSTTGANGANPATPPLGGAQATILTATESGNTVTITTATADGLSAGQPVAITGVGNGYNGTFTVASTSGSKKFTYNVPTLGLSSATTGTATPLINSLAYSVGSASTLLNQDLMGLALPSVSSDGKFIAYISDASNLGAVNTGGNSGGGAGGNQPYTNVFLYNAATDTNTLVSHQAGSSSTNLTTSASGFATTAVISGDGTTVAFTDPAKDLLSSGSGLGINDQLYVWSRTNNSNTGLSAGQIVLASHTFGTSSTALTTGTTIPAALQGGFEAQLFGFTGWTADTPPSLSNNGAYVAYYDAGQDLVSTTADPNASVLNVFRYDVKNNVNSLVSHQAGSTTLSGDNPQNQVAPPDLGPSEATGPQISANGQYIAYANNSSNLLSLTSPFTTGGSTYDGRDNVFLYDASTGNNTLVSHADGSTTAPDAGGGTAPYITADGRYVSFIDVAVPVTPVAPWTATISTASESGTTVTITTSSAHALVAGDVVLIAGVTVTGYDGLYTVATVPSSTTFTYTSSQTSLAASTKGTAYLTGSGSVRLFDSQATSASTQPVAIGIAVDSGTTLDIIAGSIAPTVMSATTPAGYLLPVIAWDGLANDVVPGAVDVNSNFDVFEAISPITSATITLTPTGPPLSTVTPKGTTVGTLSTTPAGSYTYTLVDVSGVTNNNSLFSLTPTGTLTTATTFTVTTPTTYTVTVQATNTVNPGVTVTQTITVTVYPGITSVGLIPGGTLVLTTSPAGSSFGTLTTDDPNPGQTFTYTVITDTGIFQVGTDGSSFTTIGTNTPPGVYTVTVQTTDTLGLTLTGIISVTVYQIPTITSTGTTFTVGTNGSYTLNTTGYPSPSSFTITTGTLPSGVSFNTNTGVFTWTSTVGTGGQYPLTITATNTVGTSPGQPFVLTINEGLTITSTGTTFTVGTQGSYTLVTTGYPAPTSYTETGTLPANVTFSTTTGTFTGTPAAGTGGQYPVTVTATNSVGTSPAQTFVLTVNEAPTVTSTGTTFTVGTQGSYTLVTTGYPAPISYTETGTLPGNVTFSTTTGTFTGTPLPGTGGQYPVTVTATNTVGTSPAQTFVLTVNEGPTITSTGTTFTVGTQGSYTLVTTGYPAPTSYTETGTLPGNVTFSTTTGTFTGTPLPGTGGQYPVTVTATNTVGTTPAQTFVQTVNEWPPITSTGTTFTVGTQGSYTLVTTGYPTPTSYTETGTLPGNVTFSTTTGTFSGTPLPGTGGQYPVTVTATNIVGTSPAQTFVLTVNEPLTVTSTGTTFTVGTQGTYTLVTTGYPTPTSYTESGTLPANVSFSTTTGTFTGTPVAGTGGQYPVTVTATNSLGTSPTQTFVLTVNEPLTVTSTGTTFTVGTQGSYTLVTTGYPAPTSYAETGTLPTGVSFSTTTGTFTGKPAVGTGGQYTLSVTATNTVGTSAAQTFVLTVNEGPTVISTGTTFTVGTQGSYGLVTTGYPAPNSYTETGALPTGVGFSATTGTFTGKPAVGTGGQYTLSVTATNIVGTSPAQTFVLTVNEGPTVISTGTTFTVGTQGSYGLVTTGYPAPTSYTETGTLPTGVGFSTTTGVFTGKPAVGTGGQYTLSVTATNIVGTSAAQTFVLTVNEGPTVISTGTTFTVGTQGSYGLVTTGYPAPNSYTETGALPTGVGFSATTGTFTGKPAVGTGGQYTLLVTATNTVGTSAAQTFVLTVNEPLTVTSTGTTFTVGTQGSYTLVTTGYPAPTSYTETGTLPLNVGFSTTTGTFTGTPLPGTGGQYPVTVTATNSLGTSPAQTFVLSVNEPLTVTSTGTTFTVGTQGSYALVTTGYPAPTSYTETGTLPTGVGFSTTTGTFTGKPAVGTGGQYTLSVTATNSVGTSPAQTFVLTVNEGPTVISTGTTFTVGTQGSYGLVTTGYPAPTSYTETGTLPTGVGFSTTSGVFTGKPAVGTGGQYTLSVTATNTVGTSSTQTFVLTVNEPPTVTSTGTTFTVGTQGSYGLVTTGYPAPTSYTETGTLPTGVGFSTTTGTFIGNPAVGSGGLYSVIVTATNAAGTSAPQTFVLTVDEPATIISTSGTLIPGQNNTFTLVTSGYPTPTFTLTSGTLPSGIHFNPGTGQFTGIPASGVTGSFTFTITATNGIGSTFTQTFTLNIGTLPAFSGSTSAAFVAGATGGSFTVDTTGIPTATLTESGALPAGLSFVDNGDGTATIAGTPSSSSLGSYSLDLQAANGVGSATESFEVTVVAPPTFSSLATVGFVVNQAGTFTITTSAGTVDHLTEIGDLPPGLTFTDNADGTATISGTPTSTGTFTLTLTAENGTATVATQELGLTVSDSATASEVQSIYWGLLGRSADSSGLTYFTNVVNQGAPLTNVVATITTSTEFRGMEVTNLYQSLLHRAPDPSGLANFVTFLNNGGSLGQVGAAIASSPEFVAANGGTAQSAMSALYEDALGRAIDPQGSNTVNQDLQAGQSLFQVALMVFNSTEYHQLQVTSDYATYLGRTPEAGGLNYWASVLNTGVSNEMVIALMLGAPSSQEFIQRTSASAGNPAPPLGGS